MYCKVRKVALTGGVRKYDNYQVPSCFSPFGRLNALLRTSHSHEIFSTVSGFEVLEFRIQGLQAEEPRSSSKP